MRMCRSVLLFNVFFPCRLSVDLCVCVCLNTQTLDKKIKSLLKPHDKIVFSALDADSCGHVARLCLEVI